MYKSSRLADVNFDVTKYVPPISLSQPIGASPAPADSSTFGTIVGGLVNALPGITQGLVSVMNANNQMQWQNTQRQLLQQGNVQGAQVAQQYAMVAPPAVGVQAGLDKSTESLVKYALLGGGALLLLGIVAPMLAGGGSKRK